MKAAWLAGCVTGGLDYSCTGLTIIPTTSVSTTTTSAGHAVFVHIQKLEFRAGFHQPCSSHLTAARWPRSVGIRRIGIDIYPFLSTIQPGIQAEPYSGRIRFVSFRGHCRLVSFRFATIVDTTSCLFFGGIPASQPESMGAKPFTIRCGRNATIEQASEHAARIAGHSHRSDE
jgi:hypothetical protein